MSGRKSSVRVACYTALGAILFTSAAVAQSVRDNTTGAQKDERPWDPSKLSFLGVHSVPLSSDRPARETLHAFGKFTIDGALVETLRPMVVNDAGVVETPDGELFYYGPYDAGRIDAATGSRTPLEKESMGDHPSGGRTTAMAFDTRRKRLLLSRDTYLYAYDPEAKRWLWRKDIKTALLGLAYDPDRDVFYGVLGENVESRDMFFRERLAIEQAQGRRRPVVNSPLKIRHFTPDAESNVEVTAQKPLPPKPIPYVFQTTFSQGLLVLFTDHSLFVINPMTGELVYRGETTLVPDGKPWKLPASLSLSIEERHVQLKQRVATLREQLDRRHVVALAARLDYMARCIAGQFAAEAGSPQPEIHAAGINSVDRPYKTDEAICSVTVSHTGAPLILILSAYESTTWRLDIGHNVRINQIVFAGYNKHRVEGIPEGTPVLDLSQHEQPMYYLKVAPTEAGGRSREGFFSLAHAVFGSQPISFQYESNKSSFEIGPGDEKWRASYLDSLAGDVERELLIAENEDLEFTALFRQGMKEKERSAITTYSLRGPTQPEKELLSKPAVLVTTANRSNERFIVDRMNEVYSFQKGELTPLVSPEKDVSGRTTAAVYDAPRNRLLAWHSLEKRSKNSVGRYGIELIGYDVVKRVWERTGSPGADFAAVTVDEERNIFYGLVLPHFSNAIRDLVVMNKHGAVLNAIPLSQAIYWDLDAGPPQAVFVRGHLIVITPPQATLLPDGQERLVAQVIAINPASGQTFFTGRYFCD